ncbi:MAG: M1 family metallopeptidase [Leadbetterella sp.]
MRNTLLLLGIIGICNLAISQEKSIYDPALVFNPLNSQRPSTEYRSAAGIPGPNYWQNQANYEINCTLNTEKESLSGDLVIEYTNNSPDKLDFIWLQLDQNKFTSQSRGSRTTPVEVGRWGVKNFEGGYQLSEISVLKSVVGKSYTLNSGSYKAFHQPNHMFGEKEILKSQFIDDTRIQLFLSDPLQPKGKIYISMKFSFIMPENGADRCGIYSKDESRVFHFAQWYPRLCVYDDIEGWNVLPYLGQGEFYLEYGNMEYNVTLPSNYVVVGSGELKNSKVVLGKAQLDNLSKAIISDSTVLIQTASKTSDAIDSKTWTFECKNTRDVAWAASKNCTWDASSAKLPSGKRILVQSIYPANAGGSNGWGRSSEYTKHSIEFYSKMLFEYPYPVATNVGGVISGMEYPGIVFCGADARGENLFGVTDHEFGHIWFPMIVGTNERRYAWMDEGFNTYINMISAREFNKGEYDSPTKTSKMANPLKRSPNIMNIPDACPEKYLGLMAYFKPGLGLKILGDAVVGEERVHLALREYIKNWAYKHPTPQDFFQSMNNTLGEDLNWFWTGYYKNAFLIDQKIKNVSYISNKPENGVTITLENMQQLPMPVELEILDINNKTRTIKLPVEIWQKSSEWVFQVDTQVKLKEVKLNPREILPDVNPENNVWIAPNE